MVTCMWLSFVSVYCFHVSVSRLHSICMFCLQVLYSNMFVNFLHERSCLKTPACSSTVGNLSPCSFWMIVLAVSAVFTGPYLSFIVLAQTLMCGAMVWICQYNMISMSYFMSTN